MSGYNEDKFTLLLWSLTNAEIKDIIKDYNDRCILNGRKEDKMKGYSGYNKEKLIEFIKPYLSEEESQEYYKKIEPNFIKKLLADSIALVLGEDKREKIIEIKKTPEGKGYEIKIKGFQWDNETSVIIAEDNIDRQCSCRIGQNNGFCLHQMVIYLVLLSKEEISLKEFPLYVKESWITPFKDQIKMIANVTRTKNEADIMFSDNYRIFINGNLVTMQWEGEYSGKKTKDISKEKQNVDTWVTQKVVDKMLKPIKTKSQTGRPRLLVIDNYGIVSKIIARPKLVAKILKKFQAIDSTLPTDEKNLWYFMKKDLKVDNNVDFEKIKKIVEKSEKSSKR